MLLEVNTTGEASKFGFGPRELARVMPELAALSNLAPQGLMTIGPLGGTEGATRGAFVLLRRLRDTLSGAGFSLPALSMGMTGDFEAAIEEGATVIRVGRAIFGERG